MRIPIRTSRSARLARWLAGAAVPLCVLPIFMHRAQAISTATFEWIEVVAMGFATLAVVLGFFALARLWASGDRGWGRATVGLFLGFCCVGYPVYFVASHTDLPQTTDVATEREVIPQFKETVPTRALVTPADDPELADAYPNLVSRRYALSSISVYHLVEMVVSDFGWNVIYENPPSLEGADGGLNAIVMSLVGFKDEIAILTVASAGVTKVVVRSASQVGDFDFGQNGKRIEAFLLALDQAVTEFARDNVQPIPASRADTSGS